MWGKHPPGGHKLDSKIYRVRLLTFKIQFLCMRDFVTCDPEKRAERSTDIFARLLRLSRKNLTIMTDLFRTRLNDEHGNIFGNRMDRTS